MWPHQDDEVAFEPPRCREDAAEGVWLRELEDEDEGGGGGGEELDVTGRRHQAAALQCYEASKWLLDHT